MPLIYLEFQPRIPTGNIANLCLYIYIYIYNKKIENEKCTDYVMSSQTTQIQQLCSLYYVLNFTLTFRYKNYNTFINSSLANISLMQKNVK